MNYHLWAEFSVCVEFTGFLDIYSLSFLILLIVNVAGLHLEFEQSLCVYESTFTIKKKV